VCGFDVNSRIERYGRVLSALEKPRACPNFCV